MRIFLILFLIFSCICYSSKADSPLTSTVFYKAYENEYIVQDAIDANRMIDISMVDYLMNPKNPIGTKLAVVNALGWDFNGQGNASFLMDEYIKPVYKSEVQFLNKGKAEELIIYAYLLSLDDYKNVQHALAVAEKAVDKNRESFAIALIKGIIEAQNLMETDWCGVFTATDRVRNNDHLEMDLRSSAANMVFDYMDLYKEYCK